MADRPVFICGAPRSGTTLLMRILACAENVAFPRYETWFFPNIYNRMALIEKLEKDERFEMVVNALCRMSHGFYRQFVEDREVFQKLRASDQRPETLFDILQEEVAIRQNCRRWGDKSPGHEYYTEQILKAYPSAKVVYIMRDFRDVSASRKFKPTIKGGKVLLRDGIRGAMMWRKSIQQHLYNVNILPHKQYYTVRYEDILTQPEKTVRELEEFIEDPVAECLYQSKGVWGFKPLHPHQTDLGPYLESNSSFDFQHGNLGNTISSSGIGRYKQKLSMFELMAIRFLCYYEAKLTGYTGTRSDLIGSLAWLRFSTGKSKHWEGQPHCRIDIKMAEEK